MFDSYQNVSCFVFLFCFVFDPFSDLLFNPLRLLEPCDGCAAPYGYKHHMRLSIDTSTFAVSLTIDV